MRLKLNSLGINKKPKDTARPISPERHDVQLQNSTMEEKVGFFTPLYT